MTRNLSQKPRFSLKKIGELKYEEMNQEKSPIEDKKIVVIVDDDFFNIHSMGMMLNSLNIQHQSANNGKNAIDLLLLINPRVGLILMDCNMPVMDGFEATVILKEMMKNGSIKDIPIVGCTAYCDKENINRCFESGMNDVFKKPIMKNKLVYELEKYSLIKK